MSLANQYGASEIVIAIQERRGGCFPIQDLLECKLNGIKVTDSAAFFERERARFESIPFTRAGWFLAEGSIRARLDRASSELFDIAASGILLVVTLPVMLVTALCILIGRWRPYLLSPGTRR